MTVTCKSFRCTPLINGELQLVIDGAMQADEHDVSATSTRVLYIEDIAHKLRKSPKSVQSMSRRRKHPLPLNRSNGRPFLLESDLFYFLRRSL